MKKLLNFTVSLFICGAVILSGCASTPSTSLPSELRAPNGNYPKSVHITAPDFFKATGAANADLAKQKWLDEMAVRYGVEFKIVTNNFEAIKNRQIITGLFTVNSYAFLRACALNGAFLPLDDYLADNPIWNSLPEDFKSLFEVNGHIYAIPTSVFRKQMSRVIRNEAMGNTGITVTDPKSFHDFALAYFKKTTYPAGSCAMSDVTDILNAYGLYPGNDLYNQFNYDPTADCYADWLTKPAAVEALEYLRNLFNAKALSYMSSTDNASAFNYGLLASEYVPYYDYNNCTEFLTLNPEYPQILFTELSGFAMNAGTPQPQETVNLLIDMLFGSEQNYLECWLGSSDNYILNSDGTLTFKMAEDSLGNAVPPCIPNLTGGLSELFPYSDENIIYCSADGYTDTNTVIAKNKARIKMFSDSLENGSLIEIPPEFQKIKSDTYDKYISAAYKLYYKCFSDAIYMPTEKTVQQILDEYKAAMLELGGNQMLDEMNAAIGKKIAYYYG